MKTIAGLYIAYLALFVLAVAGYLANIVKLVLLFVNDAPVNAMFIGRIIGCVAAPLGALLGYF